MASTEELRNMIYSFRVSELQDLLGFAGRNKTGKKQELQSRAVELLKLRAAPVQMKVVELHKRRFHVMNMTPANTDFKPLDTGPSMNTRVGGSSSHSMGSRSNTMSGSLGYGSSVNFSNIASKPISMAAHSVSNPPYPINPDIKLKPLPFFDVMATLLQPSSLSPSGNGSFQENMFQFTLAPSQVNHITMSRDALSSEYNIQIQMRFCLLETSGEQEDTFPPSICVKVNNKVCQLPNPIPTNRPGVEPKRPSRPVNITSLCKLSPVISNLINVSWASEFSRAYVASIYLVRRLDSAALLSRLRGKGMRNPDLTRSMVKEKLQQSPDLEIATTSLRGSLICPIGKMKMQIPCRSITCTHLQCFDANLFIRMNEKKPRWICPVCDKPSTFHSLTIDGLFSEITAKTPPNCTEIQFHADGSWTPIIKEKETHDIESNFTLRSPAKKNAKKKREVEVVDLTISSDTEETWYPSDAPPNKKSATSFQGASTSSQSMSLNFQTSGISSQAAFISLPSPSSPSVISPLDGLGSSSASATSKNPIPSYSLSLDSMKRGLLGNREGRHGHQYFYRKVYPEPCSLNLSEHSQARTTPIPTYLSDPSDFDLYSLLQPPDSNQMASLSEARRNNASPDIISLD